ncbi:MAG: amidase [Actinomycetes bacterium]
MPVPVEWTATAIADAVRRRDVSPRELTEEALRRIEKHDDGTHAFQLVRGDRAPAEAEMVDVGAGLPLAGVPIAIKDNVDVAGEPTRDGSLSTPEQPQPADHEVVRRLRAAGAVVVGKTRVPELCVFGATDSPFGVSRNPWNTERTPGGSSGGSAAAVAAGMVPVAHGNDGMGSVRIPAACCGLVGIKPGAGLVPVDLGANGWYGMAENGVLATTVADAALVLSVLAATPELATTDKVPSLRVAIATNSPLVGLVTDKDYVGAACRAGELLSSAGHTVTAARMPYTTRFGTAAIVRWTAGTDDDANLGDRAKLQASIRRHAAVGRFMKRRGWPSNDARERWRAHLGKFFASYDVVVTPALARPPIAAVRWGERSWLRNVNANARYAPFTNAWNLAGYPAIVVPMGMHSTAGVPLSVQIAAPAGGEAALLALAGQLERLAPWQRHAPGFDD